MKGYEVEIIIKIKPEGEDSEYFTRGLSFENIVSCADFKNKIAGTILDIENEICQYYNFIKPEPIQ